MLQKRSLYFTLLFLGFACMVAALFYNASVTHNTQSLAEHASAGFEKKYAKCQQLLEETLKDSLATHVNQHQEIFQKDGIALYVFSKDSLVYWNNARRPFMDSLTACKKDFGTVKHRTGLYFYVRLVSHTRTAYATCLIQPHFEIQNNYLKNVFEEWTSLQKTVKPVDAAQGQATILVKGVPVLGIQSTETVFYNKEADEWCSLIFLLGFLLLLLAVLQAYAAGASNTSFLVQVLIMLVLRGFFLYSHWPGFMYRSMLYDLHVYGNGQSMINGYLGDILINACFLVFLALALHLLAQKTKQVMWVHLGQWMLLMFLFFQLNGNLKSLVDNSTLSYDFKYVFDNSWLLLPVFAAYAAYAMALFILVVSMAKRFADKTYQLVMVPLFALLIGLMYFFGEGKGEIFTGFWLFGISAVLLLVFRLSKQNLVLTLLLHVFLFSFTVAKMMHGHMQQNRLLDNGLMAQYLSEKRDAILESEYSLIPERIKHDENLQNLLNFLPNAQTELVQKLKQDYFGGYFDRYNIDFSLFDDRCTPLLSVKNPVLVNQGYFEDQIQQSHDSLPNALYFISNHSTPSLYMAYIPLQNKRLYVLLEPKQFEETGSFPDLLIDQSLQKQNKLKHVSFAVYHASLLVNRSGDFIYPDFYDNTVQLPEGNDHCVHYVFQPEPDTRVIISEPAKTWQYFFTFNSYLLLFFAAFIYVCYLLYVIVFTPFFKRSSLTRRIQTVIILLLLCSMSAVGLISGNLVIKQFETKNQKQLAEKTQLMLSELTGQFKAEQLFDSEQYNVVNLKLKEYARLFNTPVSMFNAAGKLVNTSENKLYDMGLAAGLANPLAYHKLKDMQLSTLCIHEKAGSLDYMSMYTPIFDAHKRFLGMINLPYFARQNDLSNELSGIISALINVYVILIVISVLAGVILSGYITRPLRLIQQQIAKISLGKQNEKITWNSKDEIGKLVFEYNQMLLKLEESANQLAQSERESAWREMAKQVAHEIKNPLTPMKLNLQYLQHLKKANADDFAEKFEKVSVGIIEQIDSLATIAGEFSHFAKFPETQVQAINLVEIIASATAIFENQQTGIILNKMPTQELLVRGDREQCLRVFNNLLKNAIQAVEAKESPQVIIEWVQDNPGITIAVKDNGCGIDDNLKQKIFSPNFTTKSTGSGLGLAMVKNCMTGFGGTVFFTSTANEGSTFYLQFVPASEA